MGQIIQPQKVKLIAGLLLGVKISLDRVKELLTSKFGIIDAESKPWDFTYTDYYQKELGNSIQRMFLSFDASVSPGDLPDIKRLTNRWEEDLGQQGKRSVNIDPGYVALSKLVLATTKEGNYRVYMRDGIYGQSTLYFEKGSFRPWPWTYADYKDERTIVFFNSVRARFVQQSHQEASPL